MLSHFFVELKPKITYHCYECAFSAVDESNFNRHIRRKHPDALYQCNICNETFKNPTNLQKHKKAHEGIVQAVNEIRSFQGCLKASGDMKKKFINQQQDSRASSMKDGDLINHDLEQDSREATEGLEEALIRLQVVYSVF